MRCGGGDAGATGGADGNRVTIGDQAKVGTVIGGTGNLVRDNDVYIEGGMVTGSVTGGVGNKATTNSIYISGGTVSGAVTGGVTTTADGEATGNTVTLAGGNLQNADIFGGASSGGNVATDVVSGNTLNIRVKDLEVRSVDNFENWNFYLPDDIADGDKMLKVTDTVDMTAGGKVTPKVGVSMPGGGSLLQEGHKVHLVYSDKGVTSNIADGTVPTRLEQGVSAVHDLTLGKDANSLYVRVGAALMTKNSGGRFYANDHGGFDYINLPDSGSEQVNIVESVSGDVMSKTITMTGGDVSGVYGNVEKSISYQGKASVTMTGGTAHTVYGSRYGQSNRVVIGGTAVVSGPVYGGTSHWAGMAGQNEVTVEGNAKVNSVIGGVTAREGGTASEAVFNTVTIGGSAEVNDGAGNGMVAGGLVEKLGTARSNTVNLNGGNLRNARVFGSVHRDGTPYERLARFGNDTLNVRVKDLEVKGVGNFENWNFYLPADIGKDDIMLKSEEKVDMTAGGAVTPKVGVAMPGGGTLLQDGDQVKLVYSDKGVTSGIADGTAPVNLEQGVSALHTNLTLGTGDSGKSLYVQVGAGVDPGPTTKNTGGTLDASGNYIGVSGSDGKYNVKIIENVSGYVAGHQEQNKAVSGSSVTMTNGNVSAAVYGGKGSDVANAAVTMTGGTAGGVMGGQADAGDATGNKVVVGGTAVVSNGAVVGGMAFGGKAGGNEVTVSGQATVASVTGAQSYGDTSGNKGDASGNMVTVGDQVKVIGGTAGGSSFPGSVIGGVAGLGGKAVNNTVNLEGGDLHNAIVAGGINNDSGKDVTTGNTLNVRVKDLEVKSVSNFENWNFYLPDNIADGNKMLKVTDAVDMTAGGAVTPKVGVAMPGGGSLLQEGHKVHLVYSDKGVESGITNGAKPTRLDQGVSATYPNVTLGNDTAGKSLYVQVGAGVDPGPTTKNTGGDLDADGNYIGNSASKYQVGIVEDVAVDVYGRKDSAGISGAAVTMSSGAVGGNVYGARSDGSGDVTGSKVTMSGGSAFDVFGGNALTGKATDNSVVLSGKAALTGGVVGGASGAGAQNNTVTVSGAAKAVGVIGGAVMLDQSGKSKTGDVVGNSVVIRDTAEVAGVTGGATGDGKAEGNSVVIGGGTVNGTGGVTGGTSGNGGAATGNSVTINSGTVNGQSPGNFVTGATAGDGGNATGNIVTITGGTVAGQVSGGSATSGGKATDNIVVLAGGNLAGADVLGGSSFGANAAADVVSGNTLYVTGKGLTVRSVGNFQHWNFLVPGNMETSDPPMLTSTAAVDMTSGGKVPNPSVGVAMAGGGGLLQVGDRVTLLHSDAGLTPGAYTSRAIPGQQGVSAQYTFNVSHGANDLYAAVAGFDPNAAANPGQFIPGGDQGGGGGGGGGGVAAVASPQAKAVVEGRAAAATLTVAQGDLVAGGGMASALGSVRRIMSIPEDRQLVGVAPFGAVSAGYTRYNTGSHVDVTGGSGMVGVAKRFGGDGAEGLVGGFAEFGASHLKTHNTNAGFEQNGKGDASFFGGGVLARLEATGGPVRGLYGEGSFRLGRMDADWSGNFRWGGAPWRDSYDTDSSYMGAHAGVGYIAGLSEGLSLDLYTRYLWSHLEGDEMRLNRMRDPYKLDDVDSHRLRVGLTMTQAFSPSLSGYVGGAWEHEFDGDAHATTYQILDVPAPSFGGDSGIIDAGLIWQTGGFSTQAGLSGYFGTRRGIAGNLLVKYEF